MGFNAFGSKLRHLPESRPHILTDPRGLERKGHWPRDDCKERVAGGVYKVD